MSSQLALTLRGRRVARELRDARLALGYSLERASELCGLSAATISRIENRESKPRLVNVRALVRAYNVEPALAKQLEGWAKNAERRGWWASVDDSVMPPPYKDLAGIEEDALLKRSFEPLLVPGLLQAEGYMRGVFEASGLALSEDQIEERLSVRALRQEAVDGMRLQAVVLEETLRRPVGGKAAHLEQLKSLADDLDTHRVSLRAIPVSAGGYANMNGSFSIFSFVPPDEDIGYEEATAGQVWIEDKLTVDLLIRRFDALTAAALDESKTRKLILGLLKEYQ